MNLVLQHDQMDCGAASLAMISSAYGKHYSLQFLREKCFLTKNGASLLGLNEAAEDIGFETFPAKLDLAALGTGEVQLPVILHWNHNHYVVLSDVTKNMITGKKYYKIADPAHGFITLSEQKFKSRWLSNAQTGIALLLKPTQKFFDSPTPIKKGLQIRRLLAYLTPHTRSLVKVALLMLLGSGLTLIFPFLTEALIDRGVNGQNLDIIYIILFAQLGVYVGSITIEVLRNWITLKIGTLLSIDILSDFLKKLLQLPIKFFEGKLMGDFQQRIQDNERVEEFLTSQSLTTFFSIVTFSVFFGVLWYYDFKILLAYFILTVMAIIWSVYWLRKRKVLDYHRFQDRSENQEMLYELIRGITEMKLNNFEEFKRQRWESLQHKYFETNVKILRVDQIQASGFQFLNQIKNILVTFLAARYVIQGTMTLGALLSISYIIGQMNSPVNQLITFFRSLQDAKLSLERLNEVQDVDGEEQPGLLPFPEQDDTGDNSIILRGVSFQYQGPRSPYALRDVNMKIPEGKVTAIVGASGSGKSTLMKLLLQFYPPTEGSISINGVAIESISPKKLRKNCGVVMQDGYIFSDTVARNVATDDENIDSQKLKQATELANIQEYVDSLPSKYSTKIGAAGNGMSGGQKQRLFIARAIYKDPAYLFFDEATSALDADNEKIIHDNLQRFFKGRTVLLIAHRLSTVKKADQIVVLKKGRVVERGTHSELVSKRGEYFGLVKNQLELGD